jgi:hypothetical protein
LIRRVIIQTKYSSIVTSSRTGGDVAANTAVAVTLSLR